MKTALLPTLSNEIPSEVEITTTTRQDIPEIIALMKNSPEVSWCEWEDISILEKAILDNPNTNLVAKKSNKIIGAIIGGSFGVRGTISHLLVKESYRYQGLGCALAKQALKSFKLLGIQRIFLFVINDNLVGYNFWHKMGFQLTEGETTFEVDL
ncbi:MAG: GNAT family N-acetyltransferase [Symploca sp. SIO2B6]|nr:GNAT family N-acetyltransferase [Symploca sp. SIO2B6]